MTTMPAIVLGIVGFILIEKSGGRLTGRNFAVLGVVIPVLVFFVLLWPMLLNIRQKASRMSCGTNMAEIGMSIMTYANDYDGKFPRSGGKESPWDMRIPDWKANNRFAAYGLAPDGSGGMGSITSSFYLLVKYSYPPAQRAFVCKGDAGATVFRPADEGEGGRELIDFWDFGPEPTEHCSYSYHQPFSSFPLTTSSEPGMAVAADRNPWIESPASEGKAAKFAQFFPTDGRDIIKIGNATQHQEHGQNVLFVDFHVAFEGNSFCGFNDDNIYTFWDGPDIRKGGPPVGGVSEPKDKLDSFLVHDGQGWVSPPGR
jgi:prepilin-type processing-associated H-X9-DG protein